MFFFVFSINCRVLFLFGCFQLSFFITLTRVSCFPCPFFHHLNNFLLISSCFFHSPFFITSNLFMWIRLRSSFGPHLFTDHFPSLTRQGVGLIA
jgi:hypothetical protein